MPEMGKMPDELIINFVLMISSFFLIISMPGQCYTVAVR